MIVNLLCDGKMQGCPLFVALLMVGWNRVVDECLDALFLQVLLQAVAFCTKDGEGVVDVLCIVQQPGHADERMVQVLVIVVGYLLTMAVVIVQMAQLYIEDSSLDFVQTTVAALVFEDVFTRRTIIGNGSYAVGQLLVVGGDGSGIAQRP